MLFDISGIPNYGTEPLGISRDFHVDANILYCKNVVFEEITDVSHRSTARGVLNLCLVDLVEKDKHICRI